MNNNKIVLCFPNCEDVLGDDIDRNKLIFVNIDEFMFINRLRTEEEIKNKLESINPFLRTEKYINRIKNEYIKVSTNTDYPNNFIEYMKNILKEETEEPRTILIAFNIEILNILKDIGLNYVLIFPKKQLKEEWVGRYYLKAKNDENYISLVHFLATKWDYYLDILVKESFHKDAYVLNYGEKINKMYLEALGKTISIKDGALYYGYEG